jgi:hypothetical protein
VSDEANGWEELRAPPSPTQRRLGKRGTLLARFNSGNRMIELHANGAWWYVWNNNGVLMLCGHEESRIGQ